MPLYRVLFFFYLVYFTLSSFLLSFFFLFSLSVSLIAMVAVMEAEEGRSWMKRGGGYLLEFTLLGSKSICCKGEGWKGEEMRERGGKTKTRKPEHLFFLWIKEGLVNIFFFFYLFISDT